MTDTNNLVRALVQLETQMRQIGLWVDSQPTVEAMASREPFACDLMSFPEWLQYIFIPRLFAIIEEQAELPSNSDIAPMAEHFFTQNGLEASDLVVQIREIDRLLTAEI